MKNFCQQQNTSQQEKRSMKKSRVGKYTIFFICLPLRYKFRIREKTGIFPTAECRFLLQLFFPSCHDIKQYFLGFSTPAIQCEKIFC